VKAVGRGFLQNKLKLTDKTYLVFQETGIEKINIT